jgi:hypothetical protein
MLQCLLRAGASSGSGFNSTVLGRKAPRDVTVTGRGGRIGTAYARGRAGRTDQAGSAIEVAGCTHRLEKGGAIMAQILTAALFRIHDVVADNALPEQTVIASGCSAESTVRRAAQSDFRGRQSPGRTRVAARRFRSWRLPPRRGRASRYESDWNPAR